MSGPVWPTYEHPSYLKPGDGVPPHTRLQKQFTEILQGYSWVAGLQQQAEQQKHDKPVMLGLQAYKQLQQQQQQQQQRQHLPASASSSGQRQELHSALWQSSSQMLAQTQLPRQSQQSYASTSMAVQSLSAAPHQHQAPDPLGHMALWQPQQQQHTQTWQQHGPQQQMWQQQQPSQPADWHSQPQEAAIQHIDQVVERAVERALQKAILGPPHQSQVQHQPMDVLDRAVVYQQQTRRQQQLHAATVQLPSEETSSADDGRQQADVQPLYNLPPQPMMHGGHSNS